MQTGFSLKELGASMITAGIGGGMAAKFPTLSSTPLLQRLLKNGVTVLTAQLAEVSLNLRHDIDPRAIAAQMLGATMGEDISAQFGDSVADQATAAALSTASSAVLGSAITHTPLDAENLAETMLGTAIGTSIGAKFAPKPGEDLLGNKHTTKHVPSITKTGVKHDRTPTAAEKQGGSHQPHKPQGPKHKLYDPNNDPIIQQAEAVANMSLPSAGLDLSQDAVGKQQAIYNASAAQHQNWQVDHSVMGGLDRSWHYIKNRVKSYAHFYDNYIVPSMQGLATVANGPFPYSTSMSLAMNVGLPLATSVMNWPSTMAANYRNFVNMDANDKTYTIITGTYNNLEQVAIGLGSEGIGAVSKLGMFAVAAKATTAAKAIAQQTAKLGRNAARFFGGKELLTPEQQLTKALQESKVYEILENIHSNSPNAAAALRGKLSGLRGAQLSADITREMPSGAIRYYDKFRPSRTAGPSSGSRFVTEYNPKTGDVTMWNEVYDQQGIVNRVHLKNINGIEINSPHFPPTLKETLTQDFNNSYTSKRGY